MTVQLTQADFQRVVSIMQKIPEFANVRDRRRLLEGTFQGLPRGEGILALLDLDGTPMSTAVSTVTRLINFGQIEYGKEALGILLNYILPLLGDADQEFVTNLFITYPLNSPVYRKVPLGSNWRGADDLDSVQEKIIGENTLKHVFILQLALEASKAVVQVKTESGLGTGFMIAPDIVMTNHHVIATRDQAESAEFIFNYQLDRDRKPCEAISIRSLSEGLFYANQELDFAVIQLDGSPTQIFEPLKLKKAQARKGDRVTIIQHPGGHVKKISMQNNFVEYADSRVVQYTTSTEPGSSGSPVFNDAFEVIAIHHSGGMLAEPQSGYRYLRNEGISMIAVAEAINATLPSLLETRN